MNRRDVLKGAVGAAVVGGASTATAAPVASVPPLSQRELNREIDRLNHDLDVLENQSSMGFSDDYIAALGDDSRGRASYERMLRSTIRTLTVAETLSSLPEANRQDPRVLEVVGIHAAEMEYAYQGQLSLLQSFSADQKRAVRKALQDDPDLAMGLGEQLDGLAFAGALPSRRRRRLKKLVKHATWRLQRQPLDTVVDELLESTEKLGAMAQRSGTSDDLAAIIEARGELRAWEQQSNEWNDVLGTEPVQEEKSPLYGGKTRGESKLKTAKILFTLSAVLGGIGGLMVGSGTAIGGSGGVALGIVGLFPVTGFVVLLVIAIVFLAVALVLRAREKKQANR